jgi:hypothetical protein
VCSVNDFTVTIVKTTTKMSQITDLLAPISASLDSIDTSIAALQAGGTGGGALSPADLSAVAAVATRVSTDADALKAIVAGTGGTVTPPPPGAPVIAPLSPVSGPVGTAMTINVTATNTPTSFGATGLPAGLTIDTSRGIISGTPSARGSFSVTLTATNAAGSGSATLSITVA